jgi:hypothetical protein
LRGAPFDLVFAEFGDRDAGYRQVMDGAGAEALWTDEDDRYHARLLARCAAGVDRAIVLWQIPLGNSRPRWTTRASTSRTTMSSGCWTRRRSSASTSARA